MSETIKLHQSGDIGLIVVQKSQRALKKKRKYKAKLRQIKKLVEQYNCIKDRLTTQKEEYIDTHKSDVESDAESEAESEAESYTSIELNPLADPNYVIQSLRQWVRAQEIIPYMRNCILSYFVNGAINDILPNGSTSLEERKFLKKGLSRENQLAWFSTHCADRFCMEQLIFINYKADNIYYRKDDKLFCANCRDSHIMLGIYVPSGKLDSSKQSTFSAMTGNISINTILYS